MQSGIERLDFWLSYDSLKKTMLSHFHFGRIAGAYRYVPDARLDARHRRPVEWIDTDIDRSRFDSDPHSCFDLSRMVFSVFRNDAEARIERLLEGRTTPAPAAPRRVGEEA